jgi:hypothetical protein
MQGIFLPPPARAKRNNKTREGADDEFTDIQPACGLNEDKTKENEHDL